MSIKEKDDIFLAELVRQFGKKDALRFNLSPDKFAHHFDPKTLAAYEATKGEICRKKH